MCLRLSSKLTPAITGLAPCQAFPFLSLPFLSFPFHSISGSPVQSSPTHSHIDYIPHSRHETRDLPQVTCGSYGSPVATRHVPCHTASPPHRHTATLQHCRILDGSSTHVTSATHEPFATCWSTPSRSVRQKAYNLTKCMDHDHRSTGSAIPQNARRTRADCEGRGERLPRLPHTNESYLPKNNTDIKGKTVCCFLSALSAMRCYDS
jgi:hypothetical protein